MAASATDKFKKVGVAGTATALSSPGHSISGTSITVDSTANWPTDTGVTFAIRVVDSSGELVDGTYTEWNGTVTGATSIGNMSLVYGTDQVYPAGSTTQVYIPVSAYRDNTVVDGILENHTQAGGHKTLTDDNGNEWLERGQTASAVNHVKTTNAATGNGPTIEATGSDTNADLNINAKGTGKVKIDDLQLTGTFDGWAAVNDTPDTVTYNGNRNYDLVFNSVDLSNTLSPGMKLKATRTVAAPDQCADLEASSSQYFSKSSPAGMTFTDDFTVSAWVKLESYSVGIIASRWNGTSGWYFYVGITGQVYLVATNASAVNFSQVYSYASLPLNKWVHVTAQLDMSAFTATTTTSYVMFDGVDVAATVTRGGTNPTALVQAGNLEIGSYNGGTSPFDGKLAQVAIFNAKVTQATMRTYMSQGLSGSETSLISAYSFDNAITDLNTTNANNLTANGGAAATATDSPFANAVTAGVQEYAEVNSVTFSTNTTVNVRVPDTCMIPTSGTISATYYAVGAYPYGLPYFSKVIGYAQITTNDTTGGTAEADVNGLTVTVYVPTGARIALRGHVNTYNSTGAAFHVIRLKESTTTYATGNSAIVAINAVNLTTPTALITPTSGSHTYKISQQASGGNKNIEATVTEPAYIAVELV